MIFRIVAKCGSLLQGLYWRAVYAGFRRQYRLPASFWFNGPGIQFYGPGTIECGEGSYIGALSTVLAAKGCKVTIGESCRIAHNVRLYTETMVADSNLIAGPMVYRTGDIEIGDGVWIGVNVFMGPGLRIGSDSVVGANSVVTTDIPSGEIWAGIPAKRIRAKQPLDRSLA